MFESKKDITALEQKIGYSFNDRELIERALTHSSYSNEIDELTEVGEDE